MNTPVVRVVLFIVVFGLVVTLPWWLTVVLLVALTIYLSLYLEVLFFGFLIDTIYSPNLHFPYIALTASLVIVTLVYFIKTKIRV